ncbi:MAG: hypothetical protein AAF921_24755 [Cyanobacteria bacterium P01_D01_bin.44]
MKQFLLSWSLISPGCLILITSFLRIRQIHWHPAYPDLTPSLLIYGTYWVLVSGLQSLLLWRVQGLSFALKWCLTTATTGFALMLAHDLFVLEVWGVDTRGQGGMAIGLSVPVLLISGGLILGFMQFWLIRHLRSENRHNYRLHRTWFLASWMSWGLSSFGILFLIFFLANGGILLPTLFLLAAAGTALKGLFLMKYLRI